MVKMSYAEQLKHPNWQRKRLDKLNEQNWTCESCDSTEDTLHVHHKEYKKGRMAWEYSLEELEVLCKDCHQEHHEHAEIRQAAISAIMAEHEWEFNSLVIAMSARLQSDEITSIWIDPIAFFIGENLLDALQYLDIAGARNLQEFIKKEIEESKKRRESFKENRPWLE